MKQFLYSILFLLPFSVFGQVLAPTNATTKLAGGVSTSFNSFYFTSGGQYGWLNGSTGLWEQNVTGRQITSFYYPRTHIDSVFVPFTDTATFLANYIPKYVNSTIPSQKLFTAATTYFAPTATIQNWTFPGSVYVLNNQNARTWISVNNPDNGASSEGGIILHGDSTHDSFGEGNRYIYISQRSSTAAFPYTNKALIFSGGTTDGQLYYVDNGDFEFSTQKPHLTVTDFYPDFYIRGSPVPGDDRYHSFGIGMGTKHVNFAGMEKAFTIVTDSISNLNGTKGIALELINAKATTSGVTTSSIISYADTAAGYKITQISSITNGTDRKSGYLSFVTDSAGVADSITFNGHTINHIALSGEAKYTGGRSLNPLDFIYKQKADSLYAPVGNYITALTFNGLGDVRYLQLTGGTMTGSTVGIANAQGIATSSLVSPSLYPLQVGDGVADKRALFYGTNVVQAKFSYPGSSGMGMGSNSSGVLIFSNDANTNVASISQSGKGTFAGNLSATLPAYSSGTYLPVVYNSTNGRFETTISASPPIHGNYTNTLTGATVITVTIGSTMGNSSYYTSITPRDLVTAVNYYISAQTTTTFAVTFVSALTGSVSFDWNVTP